MSFRVKVISGHFDFSKQKISRMITFRIIICIFAPELRKAKLKDNIKDN